MLAVYLLIIVMWAITIAVVLKKVPGDQRLDYVLPVSLCMALIATVYTAVATPTTVAYEVTMFILVRFLIIGSASVVYRKIKCDQHTRRRIYYDMSTNTVLVGPGRDKK